MADRLKTAKIKNVKILLVVHYYLPRHQAGTEIYTRHLARALAHEHEVRIFTSEDGVVSDRRFAVTDDEHEGIPVRRLVHPGPPDFLRSYSDPEFDAEFGRTLDQFRPDLVHFLHLFRLSLGFPAEARKRQILAILTLADFWFLCPPILLLKPHFELCPGPDDAERCAACGNAIGKFYSGEISPWLGGRQHAAERVLQLVHQLKRRLPRPLVDFARSLLAPQKAAELEQRLLLLRARLRAARNALSELDLVLAPSRFLREKMIEARLIAPEKIIFSDYGFDLQPFQNLQHTSADHLRLGFMGTLVEHKGAHVLIEAMNLLADTSATLDLFGDLTIFPAYAQRLKKLCRNPRVNFRGRFENPDAGKILSSLDALAVPSLWFENSPLTIHEAFLARVPVVASNLGGMAELVTDNVSGLTFQAGDPADLARALRRLITEPGLLDRLRQGVPPVKTIKENVSELTAICQGLRQI
jgi:glycosyltransferase involved in cell wall biosynthesis